MTNREWLRFITVVISLLVLALTPVALFEKEDYSYLFTIGLALITLRTNLKYN